MSEFGMPTEYCDRCKYWIGQCSYNPDKPTKVTIPECKVMYMTKRRLISNGKSWSEADDSAWNEMFKSKILNI